MSNIKEAIQHFKYGLSHDIFSEPVASYAREAVAALEKQTPKRPKRETNRLHSCPICGRALTASYLIYNAHCGKCGQALSFDVKEAEDKRGF